MHWGNSLVLPQVLTEHLRRGREEYKRHPPSDQRKALGKHWDSDEQGRAVPSLYSTETPSSGKITTRGEDREILSKASWSGLPTAWAFSWGRVTLNYQCLCCGLSVKQQHFHWSAQEMRTGVWASSFFWLSAKLLGPLKQDKHKWHHLDFSF